LTALTPFGLTLDVSGASRTFDGPQIRQVQRYGDSLRNGALIGLAVATPAVLIADPQYKPCADNPQRQCAQSDIPQRIAYMGALSAIGAGIDALIRGREQVFVAARQTTVTRRLRVAPDLLRRGGSVALIIAY
jgi:hypothetical protein